MQRLEVSCAVRPIYWLLGAKGLYGLSVSFVSYFLITEYIYKLSKIF
jgi:hypothetical protein